ncbi:MAG: DUF3592 domain-containing protein [Aquificae bacterium]|nr:DUF3592 domain-containing protein [Aquificota bacterium]
MKDGKFLFLPFGFWVSVLGLITLFLFYRLVRVYFWKKTEGVVLKSSLRKDISTISYDYFYPDVEYKYTVKGKEYISNKVFLTEIASDEGTIKRLISQFPEGAKVKVYYNPLNPKEAVLKRSYHAGMFIQTLVFVSMLSVFLFTLVFEILYYGSDISHLAQIVKSWLHKIIYGE